MSKVGPKNGGLTRRESGWTERVQMSNHLEDVRLVQHHLLIPPAARERPRVRGRESVSPRDRPRKHLGVVRGLVRLRQEDALVALLSRRVIDGVEREQRAARGGENRCRVGAEQAPPLGFARFCGAGDVERVERVPESRKVYRVPKLPTSSLVQE